MVEARANKTCFVICPIGDEGTEIRTRSNEVIECVIAPAVQECGYGEPIRADLISEPGIITNQIIEHLIKDDLVIADLAGSNANVFYELAIRHVTRKPVVYLYQEGQRIPFDLSQMRAIPLDHLSLRSAKQAVNKIIRQVNWIEKNLDKAYNPISVALDLQELRRSNKPAEKLMAGMAAWMSDLSSQIQSLHNAVNAKSSTPGVDFVTRDASQVPGYGGAPGGWREANIQGSSVTGGAPGGPGYDWRKAVSRGAPGYDPESLTVSAEELDEPAPSGQKHKLRFKAGQGGAADPAG